MRDARFSSAATSTARSVGGNIDVQVVPAGATDCDWRPTTALSWIRTLRPETDTVGPGVLHYESSPNPDFERVGYITVNNKSVLITQRGQKVRGNCGSLLSTYSLNLSPSNFNLDVFVTEAAPGCNWSVQPATQYDWLFAQLVTDSLPVGRVRIEGHNNTSNEPRTGWIGDPRISWTVGSSDQRRACADVQVQVTQPRPRHLYGYGISLLSSMGHCSASMGISTTRPTPAGAESGTRIDSGSCRAKR